MANKTTLSRNQTAEFIVLQFCREYTPTFIDTRMLAMTLAKAPLVEIIAELRWAPPSQSTDISASAHANIPQQFNPLIQSSNDEVGTEEFFSRFGDLAQALGFSQTERMLPVGFPMVAHQPILRFRKGIASQNVPLAPNTHHVLYQVGAGIFTANTTPPYGSWKTFVSDVRNGIQALLDAREKEERDSPFTYVSIRYLNSFEEELIGKMSVAELLEDVFKIGITLPPAIEKNIVDGGKYRPTLQLVIPLQNEAVINLAIGEGFSYGKSSIIMDATFATTSLTDANLDAVMNTLITGQSMIHKMFLDLIEPIRDRINLNLGE